VALGQRAARSSGRPGAKWSRRGREDADVSWPGSQAGGATTSPSELKSLTRQASDREGLAGPATRPITPLAVENGVGNPAALERRRLMPVGKERVANSHPPFVPVRPKGRAGT